MRLFYKDNTIVWRCNATGKVRCTKTKEIFKFQYIARNDLLLGEIVFLFFFAFPKDMPNKTISEITELSTATVSTWQTYYNTMIGLYLDEYF